MIDATTKKPLRVSRDGATGPYILVPLSQLQDIERLLDEHNIIHSVDENAISLDDEPYIAIVNLERDIDANAVQLILDGER